MSAVPPFAGAWGGDPSRKQTSILAARAGLAAGPAVMCNSLLRLGSAQELGNVYCAAYGTADPIELEARAGVPVCTLLLASAALAGCEYWGRVGTGLPRLVGGSNEAPIRALEAIRVGADPLALARNYVVDLMGQLARLRDREGRGLTPDQQALVTQLAKLHDGGCTDPAVFRAFRRTAMAATDTVQEDLAATALRFVESVSWPLDGLTAELPEFVMRMHVDLRAHLAPGRISPSEQATLDALSEMYGATGRRLMLDPTLDLHAEYAKVETTPEYAAANEPDLLARLDRYDIEAAEAYAPFAVDLLLGAFRRN